MSQYYAYDTDGDGCIEYCAELGAIEADSMEDAADFWPTWCRFVSCICERAVLVPIKTHLVILS